MAEDFGGPPSEVEGNEEQKRWEKNTNMNSMSGWKYMQGISPLTLSIVVVCGLYGGQWDCTVGKWDSTNMAAWNVRFLKGVHPAKV